MLPAPSTTTAHPSPVSSPSSASSVAASANAGSRTQGAVSLRGVTKRFGSFTAVNDVSLDIAAGEFLALLGPSGCGKTTLLRMIAGFEQPSDGEVLISGERVNGVPPHKRDVNTMFQQYALFPHMTIRDNVAFGLKAKKVGTAEITKRVDAMLEIVHLTDFATRKPAQLSGGQQQRCALARALVNRPSALLLDEPLGALDLKLRHTMQNELKRIHRETGTTFICVTHDQEEALTMSERIAVMSNGRIEQLGSPVTIYDKPASAFVAGFIGTANLFPGKVTGHNSTTADVMLTGGRVVHAPTHGVAFQQGDEVSVMVRPEWFSMSLTEPTTPCRMPVTVVDTTFYGPILRVTARSDDGITIGVQLVDDRSVIEDGTRAWLHWLVDDASIIRGHAQPGVTQESLDSSPAD
jgi:spermidine/putrescine transport system ATP-binding protein